MGSKCCKSLQRKRKEEEVKKIDRSNIVLLIKNSPLGKFDEELKNRKEALGQKNSDRKKAIKCIKWILETKTLFTLENKKHFQFRKTPGFFNKVEVWKGKKLQLLFHIFDPNEPKFGVIHNHNHGFYFQNVSIDNDSNYRVSLFTFMKLEQNIEEKNHNLTPPLCTSDKNLVHTWSREPSSGILKKMKPKRGKLKKIYEHSYIPYTGPFFIEQNTFHQVTEGTGQIISIILREANYHGKQKVYSNSPELPADQNFGVVTPPEEEQISQIKLLQKMQKNYDENNFGKKKFANACCQIS